MQTDAAINQEASPHGTAQPARVTYPPLAQVTRTHVDTEQAAYYLNRRPQTLRGWKCFGSFPHPALMPLSINGRLSWPVAGIRAVLGV